MKKILFLVSLLTVFFCTSQAQTIQNVWLYGSTSNPSNRVTARNDFAVLGTLYPGIRDTTFTPSQNGAMVVRPQDGFTYFFVSNPGGRQWWIVNVGTQNFYVTNMMQSLNDSTFAVGGNASQNTTLNLRNTYQLTIDSAVAASGRGFKVNFGNDAGWDMIVKDSATGNWTRVAKGSIGQSWQMLPTGGLGWANQAGGISSVTNSDQTITFNNTSGNVVGSVNLGHNFTWTGTHVFSGPVTLSNSSLTFSAVPFSAPLPKFKLLVRDTTNGNLSNVQMQIIDTTGAYQGTMFAYYDTTTATGPKFKLYNPITAAWPFTNKSMDGGSNTFTNIPFTAMTGVLPASKGGTGVNNGSNTITLAGSLALAGAFATTLNFSASTNVTFPTSGTLYGTKSSSISSAQLALSMTDPTGSGQLVFSTSPGLTSPTMNTQAAKDSSTRGANTGYVDRAVAAVSASNSTSGVYVPAVTGYTNVTSTTADTAMWIRVGNVVEVQGLLSVTPTNGAINVQVRIPIPISSTQGGSHSGWGVVTVSQTPTLSTGSVVSGAPGTQSVVATIFSPGGTGTYFMYYHFTYLVQ